MNVMIYTIGSRDHGLGHVKRELTLARELNRRDIGVLFTTEVGTTSTKIIRDAGYTCFEYALGDFGWLQMAGRNAAETLIVDVEGDPSESLIDRARAFFGKVIVISAAGYAPQGV